MTFHIAASAASVVHRRQFSAGIAGHDTGVKPVLLVELDGDIGDIRFHRGGHEMVGSGGGNSTVMTSGAVEPPFRCHRGRLDMRRHQVGSPAAAVILKTAVGEVSGGAEGKPGDVFGQRRIAVTGVAIPCRFEGPPRGVVAVTGKTAAGVMAGFGGSGAVVGGLGVADLTETAVVGRIDEAVRGVGIGDRIGGGVGPGTLQLGPDHGEVAAAVGIMTELAEHILRPTLDREVSAHILKGSDGLARNLVAGRALTVVIGLSCGEPDGVADDSGDVRRRGVMTGGAER